MMFPEKAIAQQIASEYIQWARSTKNANIDAIQQAAFQIYKDLGYAAPRVVLHVSSPYAVTIARWLLDCATNRWRENEGREYTLEDRGAYFEVICAVAKEITSSAKKINDNVTPIITNEIIEQIRHQMHALELTLPSAKLKKDINYIKLETMLGMDGGLVEWKRNMHDMRKAITYHHGRGYLGDWHHLESITSIGDLYLPVVNSHLEIEDVVREALLLHLPLKSMQSCTNYSALGDDLDIGQIALIRWNCDSNVKNASPRRKAIIQALDCLAKECATIFWNESTLITCDRPAEIHVDESGRPHNLTGTAIRYRDGWEIHAIHGQVVPEAAVNPSSKITMDQIDNLLNIEARRTLIERYGVGSYMLDAGAKIIHCDATGLLYRRDSWYDEPIVMVRVLNSTPEPDGPYSRDEAIVIFGEAAQAAMHAPVDARFKEYMIRVPPDMTKTHEAVAWTFGLTAEDYHPALET